VILRDYWRMGFGKQIKELAIGTVALVCSAGIALAQDITVFAASSLKESLEEIARGFSAETGHTVTLSFAASSALVRQIALGAPADLFVSASADWMDDLAARGLIDPATRVDLLSNRLVLIGPVTGATAQELTARTDLTGMLADGRLAMALTEAVPAGIYAKAALQNLKLWDSVEPFVAQTDSARAALALVSLRAAPLGIVYATDALAEPKVEIRATIPPDTHPEIVYPAALTATARGHSAARLLDYLSSPFADEVFARYGFIRKGD
jgi:molybdate transport system substrate-binding protein